MGLIFFVNVLAMAFGHVLNIFFYHGDKGFTLSTFKRFSFLLCFGLMALPPIGYWLGGWFNYLVLAVVFLAIPCVDYFFLDEGNPEGEDYQVLLGDRFFAYLTYAFVLVQLLLTGYGIVSVAVKDIAWFDFVGFALSLGVIAGGIGITVAHELMHKPKKLDQTLSKVLLSLVCYGHFFIEHIRGHHVNVATPKDPATARMDESLYRFLPRTLVGSFKSAWALEQKRLRHKGLSLWCRQNQFYWIIGAPVVISLVLLLLFNIKAVMFYWLQSIVAILMLEIVNYVEHYGLAREKLANGQYERVSPKHSWNANHWLTNSLLFHLQRHSDHHTHTTRPYQVLRHLKESPQLPVGYPGMILLALLPPLWFKMMNPKAQAYNLSCKSMS